MNCPFTHDSTQPLFPASARRRAFELLLIGYQLRDQMIAGAAPGSAAATGAAASFAPDVWVQCVLPLAISRAQCGQRGRITGPEGACRCARCLTGIENEPPRMRADDLALSAYDEQRSARMRVKGAGGEADRSLTLLEAAGAWPIVGPPDMPEDLAAVPTTPRHDRSAFE